MTIQVRASLFDQYAFMTEYPDRLGGDAAAAIDEKKTPLDWIAEFTGEVEETERMIAGTAFHRLLAEYATGRTPTEIEAMPHDTIEGRPIAFKWEISPNLPLQNRAAVTAERPLLKHLKIADIAITGHADAILQLPRAPHSRVLEYKTRTIYRRDQPGTPDFEGYSRAWQWRVYLYLTGFTEVEYHCFGIQPVNDTKANRREWWWSDDHEIYRILTHDRATFYRNPKLDEEVEAIAIDFGDWLRKAAKVPEQSIEEIAQKIGMEKPV